MSTDRNQAQLGWDELERRRNRPYQTWLDKIHDAWMEGDEQTLHKAMGACLEKIGTGVDPNIMACIYEYALAALEMTWHDPEKGPTFAANIDYFVVEVADELHRKTGNPVFERIAQEADRRAVEDERRISEGRREPWTGQRQQWLSPDRGERPVGGGQNRHNPRQ